MPRRLVPSAGLVLCLSALLTANQGRDGDLAQFRTGIELIQLDVSVLDGDRRPVRGLTSGDFTVLIDGQPRTVAAFKSVEVPPPGPPPSALWMKDVAPDVVTNAQPAGRVVAIVIDDGSFGVPNVADLFAVRKARAVAREAVDELGPDDVAAVVFTENSHSAQNFTKDRQLLLNAIENAALVPSSSADMGDPYGLRRPSCHCGACPIEALGQIASQLQSLPQQRKVVVYISAGVLVAPQVYVPYNTIGNTDAIHEENCNTLKQRLMTEVFRRASLANVTIQAVDVRGLLPGASGAQPPNTGGIDLRIQYLQAMAEETGGRAVVRSNDMERQVRPLIEESSFYYLLGVEPPVAKDDGRLHNIKVTVTRPGVEVRTRRGYFAPTPDERKRMIANGPGDASAAMAGPLPKSDVPLEINVLPIADPKTPDGSSLAVVVGATRPNDGQAATARTERVRVVTTAYDPETGRSVGSQHHELDLRWSATPGAGRFEVLSLLPLKPGRYEIRAGIETGAGRTGSVYTHVEVPDFRKDALSLSGLILSVTPSARAAPPDALKGVMPHTPTAQRVFRRTDRLTAWLRLHRAKDAAGTITTRLTNAANEIVAELTEVIETSRGGDEHTADHTIDVPVEDLTPGEYLVTVEVSAGDQQARRDARFTIQ